MALGAVLVGVPLAASANPDVSGFELDGNTASSGLADWDALGSPLDSGFTTDPTGTTDRGFTTGGSKDTNDISQWKWADGAVTPAKDNIAHAYTAVYAEQNNLILYFGQDRVPDQKGDANVGFWFLQDSVGLNADGSFSGTHKDGDLLVQSDFTNGGVVSGVQVYKWQGGALTPVENQAQCTGSKLGTNDACAIVNTGTISTGWGSIPSPYFFEGGLNLSAYFPQAIPCFSTFLTNTRTSQSESAQLKDFALGNIDTCGSITVRKTATPSDGTQFDYSTTGALSPSTFKLGDGGTQPFNKLGAGQYSVTEAAQTGSWAFDSLSCSASGPGTSAPVSGQTANITLGFLGDVSCTYVNKRKPQVKVVKVTDPTTDSGRFDLQINGVTKADDVGNGGDTGFQEVPAGQTVTVGELAGTGTSLSDYVSSVSCDGDKGGANPGTSHSFTANFGDKVTCTITNRRKPEVKVVKVVEPANDAGRFNLLINGTVERADAANGQDTGFQQVAAGTVSVGETAGTGTDLGNYLSKVECDSGKGPVGPGTGRSFSVSYGERVTCTITNTRKGTLVVYKQVVNDDGGSAQASAWTMNVSGPTVLSFAGNAAGTSNAVTPGAYTVGESGGVAGYVGPSYPTSGLPLGVSQNDCNAQGQVTLGPGETKRCVLRNDDQPARLKLVKVVTNDDGGTAQASAWTLSAAGPTPISGPGGAESDVDAGTYNLSESAGPAGYTASSWVCTGTGSQNGASVSLDLGETATCTITNDDQGAHLKLVKQVVNDNGGAAQASAWTLSAAGPTPISGPGGAESDVSAGTYNLSEAGGPAGYTASSWSCTGTGSQNGASVSLDLAETATCTITNDDQPATLTVIKNVVNDNGGTASASSFTMTINGVTAAGGNSFPGASGSGVTKAITSFGAYDVSESSVAGYTQTSASADCAGTIALGQHKTCTIVNDDRAPKLTLVKEVVNDNGGTAQASAWNLAASGPTGFNGQGPSVSSGASFDAGTYNLSESGPAGYAASAWVCSPAGGQVDGDTVSVGLGDDVTCTITNDDRTAHLRLVKQVVNDNGGTAQASAWTLAAAGPTPLSGAGGAESDVDAGTYTLSESAGPAGYAAGAWSCVGGSQNGNQVTLALGGSATCTITNDDRAPKLTLVKQVVNDDGGKAVPSAWTLAAAGPTGFSGAGPTVVSPAGFDAGSYDLSESGGPAGYAASDWDCTGEGQSEGDSVSVALGDDVTCTIINDDIPATLIVKKVVVNDNGGTKVASDFSFQVNGGAVQAFESDGQNNLTVDAGAYEVSEPGVAGYTTTYQGCANIVLPLGGSATCTITNNDVPRGQGSISVSKSANPTTLKEPGGPVTFSVTITNTSADVDVSIENVVDDKFGDLDDSGGNGCFDVPVNLAPGEKVNCTFQKNITGQGGTSHVNVVTASGHDENGNALQASDDARVDITERLIDLVIVKEATSPTPLNGTVDYSLTVTNKGPDTATNVQLADPAPAGITYQTANPSQGACSVTAALITCSLGSIAPGQTVTIAIAGKATTVGQHTNTATVTGSGGRETNPADNVDSAVTVVPAPLKPPTSKPEPQPEVCLALTVSPKMIKADGKPDTVKVVVTAGKKRVKGVKVLVKGAGIQKTARTNGKGMAQLKINPKKPGLITVSVAETNKKLCGPQRIGVVGVFLPPLTG